LFQKRVEATVKLVKVRNKSRFLRKLPGVVVAAIMDDSGGDAFVAAKYYMLCLFPQ